MGDRIEIEAIEFIGNINMYQVDLYNATKDEHYRVFIPEKDIEFAILKSPQTEFERKLDEKMREFTNMIAEHLADVFETPCNYSPLDVQMCDYCEDCDGNRPVECWKRVFEMWRKNEE